MVAAEIQPDSENSTNTDAKSTFLLTLIIQISETVTIKTLLWSAFQFRLLLLFVLATSSYVIPDNNPGDDVLQFHLQLSSTTASIITSTIENTCHYWKDSIIYSFLLTPLTRWDSARFLHLAQYSDDIRYPKPLLVPDFYNTIQSNGFVKEEQLGRNISTDAHRRFLSNMFSFYIKNSISLMPENDQPTKCPIKNNADDVMVDRVFEENTCIVEELKSRADIYVLYNETDLYYAEQSHAFLPLFPSLIHALVRLVRFIVPPSLFILLFPCSMEGMVALTAWIFNTIVFVGATYELYHLTLILLLLMTTTNRTRIESSDASKEILSVSDCEKYSRLCAILFIINPATIFFGIPYSESLGAYLMFKGCRCLMQKHQQTQQQNQMIQNRTWSRFFTLFTTNIEAVVLFWLASLTRSNAILYGGFILLQSIGYSMQHWKTSCYNASKKNFITNVYQSTVIVSHTIKHIGLGFIQVSFLFLFSMGLHNYKSNYYFCSNLPLSMSHTSTMYQNHTSTKEHRHLLLRNNPGYQIPDWCDQITNNYWFHLYSYVQHKHWNVGYFRYWQWKQIPNFLLATPIIYISTIAVISWIRCSWLARSYIVNDKKETLRTRSFVTTTTRIFDWILTVLVDFAVFDSDSRTIEQELFKEIQNENNNSITRRNDLAIFTLRGSSLVLGHYAVLAATSMLGLILAHVQISTRLICSSCPALYWYMTAQLIQDSNSCCRDASLKNDPNRSKFNNSRNTNQNSMHNWTMSDTILVWCISYTVLGVILHPNWLPWT